MGGSDRNGAEFYQQLVASLEGRIGAGETFAASQLDESFQIKAWGEDSEETQRRAALAADIAAAARFIALLRC